MYEVFQVAGNKMVRYACVNGKAAALRMGKKLCDEGDFDVMVCLDHEEIVDVTTFTK